MKEKEGITHTRCSVVLRQVYIVLWTKAEKEVESRKFLCGFPLHTFQHASPHPSFPLLDNHTASIYCSLSLTNIPTCCAVTKTENQLIPGIFIIPVPLKT